MTGSPPRRAARQTPARAVEPPAGDDAAAADRPGPDARTLPIDPAIIAVLEQIHDPCSIAAGRPLSVRAMGLVRGWTLADGVLTVTFAVTFPGCTMAPHFTEAARRALGALPGVARVETLVDTGYAWTPADMPAPPAMRGVPQAWRRARQ